MGVILFHNKQESMNTVIREPFFSDIDQLMILIDEIMRSGKHYFSDALQYSRFEYENFLKNLNDGFTMMRIAIINARIVGWAILYRRRYKFQYHLGSLLIGIKEEYRHKGIGKKLVLNMEQLAIKNKIEIIEAFARRSDNNAIIFFKQMGFIQGGVEVNAIKFNGNYDDEVILLRNLVENNE